MTGYTEDPLFPTTPGAYDESHNGGRDAFVSALQADGSALVYSTLLGESGRDAGTAIALDAAGNAYIAGKTSSRTFPTTPGVFDPTSNGSADAFITKPPRCRPPPR